MAEVTSLSPTYEVSPVLAGFLGAGVLVVTVTVGVFLWTFCQRQYRRVSFKLNSGPFDSPTDPPLKFIHMLKGISIYPESLSNANKIIRVGRRSSSWQRGHECDPEGHAHLQMNHLVPPKLERALPIRANYCCSESGGSSGGGSESSSKTPTPFGLDTPSLGSLDLAVDYNLTKKALVVTIVGARGLPAVNEQTGTSDPYVKMSVLPEKKHHVKTRVMRNTLEPAFDETFTFYGVAFSSLAELTLHFLVLSFDRFARDDVIGEALVPLAGVELSAGRVHISQQISRRNVQCGRRGELLVSLSYHPATHRLNVVVLKAKHLPTMDITSLPGNPYVKVNVFYGRRRIAKKKTHVKKCTLEPVFNESFVYDVPAELMVDVSVEFLLIDFDRTAKNAVVGRLVLGGQSPTPSGVTHWREVCDNPRRQIAKWHNLSEF
ncbi:synaptotagmin-11a [Trichomycterus rosablanca]|uniref:synaptotagmin-11a n=1 Tax=Trichomycterus rosablanca TaxID=2290929 RepID=UPI002F35F72F